MIIEIMKNQKGSLQNAGCPFMVEIICCKETNE